MTCDYKERKDMIKITDLCPLFFNPLRYTFGADVDYTQKFHTSDNILIQVLTDGEAVSATLKNLSLNVETKLSLSTYQHNDSITLHYYTITGLNDGVYSILINGRESEPFIVCSDEDLLDRTTLIRYSNKDNNSAFDNIFWIGDNQQMFDFRIEGGFKPSGFTPKVDNEQYRNQFQEITELYALPYEAYTLSLGDSVGLPYWMIRHVNRLLCVSHVEIDGELYVRSESSTPELTATIEDAQLFTSSVVLEKRKNDISGIGGRPEEAASSSIIGFNIDNPVDGQMLQYSGEDNAFVNVTTVGV